MTVAGVLAMTAGTAWALNIVIVRWAVGRGDTPPLAGAVVGVAVAAATATGVALLSSQAPPAFADVGGFAMVGAIAPGSSQGLFVAAIALIGPARASVLVGTSPVFSVLLAIAFLGEDLRATIVVGTLATVSGGVLIGWERRPGAGRLGVVFGVATAVSFGVRDVVARDLTTNGTVSTWWAGAIVLGAATVVLSTMLVLRHGATSGSVLRRALPEFVASGLVIGLALPVLLAAFDRGEVGLVAPLSLAAQNVAVVGFGAVAFGATERTPRVLAAVGLVIAGGALVLTA